MKLKMLLKRHFYIVRFLIVGTVCFLLDYGMLLTTYRLLHLNLALATSIGFITGLILSFALNKYLTFKSTGGAKKTVRQGALYAVLVTANLGLTNLIILTLSHLRITPEISRPIAAILIMGISFVAYKWVIFPQ